MSSPSFRPRPVSPDDVADILAIEQLVNCYPIALDTRDYDALDEIFAPHAKLQMSKGDPLTPAQYKQMCVTELGKLDATHHFISGVVVHVDGDRAIGRAYHQAQHVKRSLAPDDKFLMAGWVTDEYERIDGRWWIVARSWRSVWSEGNPGVLS